MVFIERFKFLFLKACILIFLNLSFKYKNLTFLVSKYLLKVFVI